MSPERSALSPGPFASRHIGPNAAERRAMLEVVGAVRYTLKKMQPIIHECALRGAVTGEGARQLNHHCDLLLHGGRFDWASFFRDGIPGDSELENGVLHDLYLPPEAEYLNAAYMQELVGQQTILKPTMWERRR